MESNQTSVSSSNRSIDQVLEKIRRGMRAARIGGWVDGNDSGSEIENPSSPAFGLIATAGTTTGTTGTSSTDLYHQNNPLNHRHQRPVIHSSSPSSQPQSALGNGRLSAHNQSIASSASDGGHPNLHLQPHHWRNRANHHHQAIISEDPSPETHKLPINPSAQRHPLPQPKPRIYNRLSDGEDDPQAFLAQSAQSSDSRSVAHPSTSALVVDLPRSASADLSSLSILHPHPHPHPQLLSLSPGFGTPTSAHDPHMPLTPCSGIYPLPTFKTTGGSLGSSPYVRHHFKWEFLENPISVSSLDSSSQSNNPQPPQPRFLESSSSSTTTQTHFETSSSNVESDSPSTRDVPTKIFNRQSWKDNSSQSSTGMNTTTTRNPINSSISSSPSSSSSQSYSSSDLSQSDFKINSSNILLSSHSSPSPSPSPNPTHNSIVHQTSQLSKGSDPHPSFNQIKLNPFTTSAQLSSGTCLSSSTDSPSQFRWRSPSDSERGHLLLTTNNTTNTSPDTINKQSAGLLLPQTSLSSKQSMPRDFSNSRVSLLDHSNQLSSVQFSLPPPAPIRLTAPDGDPSVRLNCSTPARPTNQFSRLPGLDHTPMATAVGSETHYSKLEKVFLESRDKEAIRARIMKPQPLSSAIVAPQHSSNQSGHNSIPFVTPPNLSLSSQVDPSLSNSLPPATQHMRLSINQTRPGHTHSSNQAVSPIRLTSATYPSGNQYAPAVFYSSNPHGSRSSSSSNVTYNQPQSLISPSSSGDRSPISRFTPNTPISPSKFGYTGMINPSSISHSNPSPQSHSSASQSVISNYSSAPTTATVTKAPFVPVIVPVIPGIGNSVSTPLPGQVQPEEVRKSAKTQPPVVNTGNSGAMIPQPGDWMCMCGFVNWRRRKVCMRCFPFADGNDSVGAMMAINAQRAALLAAGIPIPKDFPTSANNLSSPSDSVFQSSKVSNTQDTLSPSSNSMIGLGQIFSPTGVVSKRIPDSEGISQRPTNVMSPFDKAFNAGLQKISTEKLNNRPNDAVINHRFSSGNLKSRAIDRSNANSLMACGGRSERNGDQARLCLPVDENSEQDDRVEWSEEGLIPTRHRSFSMGANMVWGNSGICDSRGDEKSEIRLESMSRDKLLGGDGCMELKSFKDEAKKFDEFGGIFSTEGLIGNTFTAYGNKDFEGGKNTGITAIGRIKDQQQQKQQEESSPIRQRTTTGSESSWQAIKALWQ